MSNSYPVTIGSHLLISDSGEWFRWGYISNGDVRDAGDDALATLVDGVFVDLHTGEAYCPPRPEIIGCPVNGQQGQLYFGKVVEKPLCAIMVQVKYKGEFVPIIEDLDGKGRQVLKRKKNDRWYVVADSELEYPRSVKVFVKSRSVMTDESVVPKSSEVWFSGDQCDASEHIRTLGRSWSKTIEFTGPRLYDKESFIRSHFSGEAVLTEEFVAHLLNDMGLWNVVVNPENYDVRFFEDYDYVRVSSATMKPEAHEALNAALKTASDTFAGRKYKLPEIVKQA